jgi:hypothetical protein
MLLFFCLLTYSLRTPELAAAGAPAGGASGSSVLQAFKGMMGAVWPASDVQFSKKESNRE